MTKTKVYWKGDLIINVGLNNVVFNLELKLSKALENVLRRRGMELFVKEASLHYLNEELKSLNRKIAVMKRKYGVSSAREMVKTIEEGKLTVSEDFKSPHSWHREWEDLMILETLEEAAKRIREEIEAIKSGK